MMQFLQRYMILDAIFFEEGIHALADRVPILFVTNMESIIVVKIKVGDRNRGRPKGSLFNSFYTEL